MSACEHRWRMTNVRFGFVAFERCGHCGGIQTHFSPEGFPDFWDEYRRGSCVWRRVETAQSLRFDLACSECGRVEGFSELMGLLFCTGCLAACPVDVLRREHEAARNLVLVAFGFLPAAAPFPPHKLRILEDHFNQRRDTSRSRVKLLPFDRIEDFSQCRGEFIHDVGMLSREPPPPRRSPFAA